MSQIHVVPADDNWHVKIEGQDALYVTTTQDDAIEWARIYAQDNGYELTIHDKNGAIREKDSSGEGVGGDN